jgi:hypothetical protein
MVRKVHITNLLVGRSVVGEESRLAGPVLLSERLETLVYKDVA